MSWMDEFLLDIHDIHDFHGFPWISIIFMVFMREVKEIREVGGGDTDLGSSCVGRGLTA